VGDEPSTALRTLFRQIERASGLSAPAAVPAVAPRRPAPPASAAGAPATVTFLLTEIEGSTRLSQQSREEYSAARERHHALLRQEFARHGAQEVRETGDGFTIMFPTAGSALAGAIAAQSALSAEVWSPELGPLQVRMVLHT